MNRRRTEHPKEPRQEPPAEKRSKSVRHRGTASGKRTDSLPEELHVLVAERAYELFAERGYHHGRALDDWLDAEREILKSGALLIRRPWWIRLSMQSSMRKPETHAPHLLF